MNLLKLQFHDDQKNLLNSDLNVGLFPAHINGLMALPRGLEDILEQVSNFSVISVLVEDV